MNYQEFYTEVNQRIFNTYKQTKGIVEDYFGESRVDWTNWDSDDAVKSSIQAAVGNRLDALVVSDHLSTRDYAEDNPYKGFTIFELKDINNPQASELLEALIDEFCTFVTDNQTGETEVRDYADLYSFRAINISLPTVKPIIYWDKVTVTNEQDSTHEIYDLYVTAKLIGGTCDTNTGYPFMKRTTYTKDELNIGYLHSHAHSISPNNVSEWNQVCLGSGPLSHIVGQHTMYSNKEELIMQWCMLIDQYVTIESMRGVPYIYMEKIGASVQSNGRSSTFSSFLDGYALPSGIYHYNYVYYRFASWFIRSKYISLIEFNKTSVYTLKTEYHVTVAIFTKAFLEFIEDLNNLVDGEGNVPNDVTLRNIRRTFLLWCKMGESGNCFIARDATSDNDHWRRFTPHKFILQFKGEDKLLEVIDAQSIEVGTVEEDPHDGSFPILHPTIVKQIINSLIEFKNYNGLLSNLQSKGDTVANFSSSRFCSSYSVN